MHGHSALESSKLERRTARSFRNGLSCELSYLMEFKNNTYQRMQRSVLVGAGDAPTWRHHDLAQLLIWLSYITAAGLAHRALLPAITSVVLDVMNPRTATEALEVAGART